MRTIVKLAYAAGALMTAGCSGADGAMNDDLKKDLEMAWSSDAITLAGADQSAGRQVVSAIERDAVPAPRRVAPSRRVAKHRPAPRTPAPVEVAEADMDEEAEAPAEVTPAPAEPAPVAVATLPSPRPQPVSVGDDAGMDGNGDRGIDRGRGMGGIISVVLRGGGVDGDDCDEHIRGGRNGRNGRGGRIGGGMIGAGRIGGGAIIAINNRIPIQGTFPGRSRF